MRSIPYFSSSAQKIVYQNWTYKKEKQIKKEKGITFSKHEETYQHIHGLLIKCNRKNAS